MTTKENRIKNDEFKILDMTKGILYIVATPIGNLEDITLRTLRVLKEVDLIACEDTRNTGQLLKHFNIEKPLVSYFQHSKLSKVEHIIEQLLAGKNIALMTDAGTPGISDPGQALISKIREIDHNPLTITHLNNEMKNNSINEKCKLSNEKINCIKIIPIPGPSAVAAAASVSGMIEKEFYFAGFLPKKKGRQTKFNQFKSLDCPIVIYESALRLERTLNDIKSYLSEETQVFIAREMTKMFEEYWGGKINDVLSDLKNHTLKGEIVVVVGSPLKPH